MAASPYAGIIYIKLNYKLHFSMPDFIEKADQGEQLNLVAAAD